jgi:hypothetical protein
MWTIFMGQSGGRKKESVQRGREAPPQSGMFRPVMAATPRESKNTSSDAISSGSHGGGLSSDEKKPPLQVAFDWF